MLYRKALPVWFSNDDALAKPSACGQPRSVVPLMGELLPLKQKVTGIVVLAGFEN